MIAPWEQYEGQAVDGIPLLRLLGGSETGAVYLGELAGSQCAIKFAPAEEAAAQIPLARWQQASKLTHPHLARIHQWGRARLNGAPLVYLAMEYGEEELGALDRPLTPKEAREMLTPAVSALLYLHGQKFAHGRIQPSNILSVNDVLKISGDAPLHFGERHPARPAPSPYDPPELADTGVSAAGDVWSLGTTLVEALTKELPVGEADPPRLPDSLKPGAFRDVAAGCLCRDPALRWTMTDLAQWLERGTVPAPKRAPRRYVLPIAAAAGVAAVGAIAWVHFAGGSEQPASAAPPVVVEQKAPVDQKAGEVVPQAVPDKPAAVASGPVAPEPASPAPKPSRASKTKPQPATVGADAAAVPAQPPAPAKDQPQAAVKQDSVKQDTVKQDAAKQSVAPPAPADKIPDDVVQSLKPEPIAKARATIRGKVPIFVRLEADPSGAVTAASIESGASSKYFAELSLKAARQWKFAPGDAAHVWLLRFEFTRDADHPVSVQASRVR
jgi:outer membrane biosynthesis protein TonB